MILYVVSTSFPFARHFIVTASLARYPSPLGFLKKPLSSPWSETRCNPCRNKKDIFCCALIRIFPSPHYPSQSSNSSHANITPIPILTRGLKINLLKYKRPMMHVVPSVDVSHLCNLSRIDSQGRKEADSLRSIWLLLAATRVRSQRVWQDGGRVFRWRVLWIPRLCFGILQQRTGPRYF